MTREDIIRLYKEANGWSPKGFDITVDELERFAALVRADEREIFCAVLRQLHDSYSLQSDPTGIRARGQA
jgi:hypothetical protein